MDNYELAVCITDCFEMTLNFLVYGAGLVFVLHKHSKTLGLFTKVLLAIPLLEFTIEPLFSLIAYATPDDEDLSGPTVCGNPVPGKIMNVLFFTRESAFLIVNIFMLKNLAVYVMFKAKTVDEEAKAKQLVRSFCWTYLAVLFVFELVNAYLSIEVFCIGCRHPGDGAAALFFTLNIAKFLLNLVLVVISFMHSIHLNGVLTEYNDSLKASIQEDVMTE